MKNVEMSNLRDQVAKIARELAKNGAATSEIVDACFKRLLADIEAVSHDLERIALTKIVNDVGSVKPKSSFVPGQGDLFDQFGVPGFVTVPIGGTNQTVKKNFENLTVNELQSWYKTHSKTRAANVKLSAEIRRLLNRIRPHVTSDATTVGEAHAAAEAADRAKEESSR